MTRILIKNATILTLDEDDTFLFPGTLEIRGNEIFDIRETAADPSAQDDEYSGDTEVIDGTDKLILPGFVDLHFHTSIAKVSIEHADLPRIVLY
jgi:5-methylthioadenosine/S-adenosylhomocysteine deaminase